MIFRATIEISCSPAEAFDVYRDVERWPEWTASVTSAERLDGGPLRVGSRTRVRQPRLPATVWTVTSLEPGREFTWEATGPGTRTTGRHSLHPADGGCLAVAELEQRGPLAPLVVALTRKLTDRYLGMETRGLKERCERTIG